jgi:expansin
MDPMRPACWLALTSIFVAAAARADCTPPFGAVGDVTYTIAPLDSACTLPVAPGAFVAAMNAEQWDGSAHCGECLLVHGPEASVVVKVTDQCKTCAAGELDLSDEAFDAIADPIVGRIALRWERVACPVDGDLELRFRGANPFFLSLQALDHREGIAAVEFLHPTQGWLAAARADFNLFRLSIGEQWELPLPVRLTGISGQQLVSSVNSFCDEVQATSVQFPICDPVFAGGFESP